MNQDQKTLIIDEVIRSRCTAKYLADEPLNASIDRDVVEEIIEAASWGPVHLTAAKVHRPDEENDSILPWRFYVLEGDDCRSLRDVLISHGDPTKVPNMLAAASALIQVTWLPDPAEQAVEGQLYDPSLQNMEHIAAGAAAVQNMLLAATARGIPTYWSSGGALRKPDVFSWLDIPEREILLGSIFLFPEDDTGAKVVPGKLRDKKGPLESWVKWVSFY